MRIQIRRLSGGVGSVPDAAASGTACGFQAAAASGTAGNQPPHRTRNASHRVCAMPLFRAHLGPASPLRVRASRRALRVPPGSWMRALSSQTGSVQIKCLATLQSRGGRSTVATVAA
jgi:hypothetical protein